MNTRAQSITDDFFNTMAEILNPNSSFSISGKLRDTPPDTITDSYTDIVKLPEWIRYQPVEPQTVRIKWEKSYWEGSDPDDAEPEVVSVEWLANPHATDDIPHWIDVTNLLKTQCDLRDLLP